METVHETALDEARTRPDGRIDLNAAMRLMLESLLNAVMDEQASELGAQRNGYRERSLDTCVGRVTLRIPKLREGTYFHLRHRRCALRAEERIGCLARTAPASAARPWRSVTPQRSTS